MGWHGGTENKTTSAKAILEEVGVGLYHRRTVQESIGDLAGGTLEGILTLTVLLFVMRIPFFAFAELQRVLGEGKLGRCFSSPFAG